MEPWYLQRPKVLDMHELHPGFPTSLLQANYQVPYVDSLSFSWVFPSVLLRQRDCLPSPPKSMFSPFHVSSFFYVHLVPLSIVWSWCLTRSPAQDVCFFPTEASHWTGAAVSWSSLSLEYALVFFHHLQKPSFSYMIKWAPIQIPAPSIGSGSLL